MGSKIGLLLISLVLFGVLIVSGCLDSGNFSKMGETPKINKTVIDDSTVVGSWVQYSTGSKLVFLSDYSFVRILDKNYINGTWRIENSNMLVLTMEAWDYDQNGAEEYVGEKDVSFGSISGDVLSFTSVNEDPVSGFPFGDYHLEGNSLPLGIAATINDEAVVGVWDDIRTNSELNFSKNHTFTQYINGQTLKGTWRIEYGNIVVLTMDTYSRAGKPLGKEDVSYGTMVDGMLSFSSVNGDFIRGFPSGDYVKI